MKYKSCMSDVGYVAVRSPNPTNLNVVVLTRHNTKETKLR